MDKLLLRATNRIRYFSTSLLSNSNVVHRSGGAITSSVKIDDNSLLINWDHVEPGTSGRFHYDWLRDNCGCSKCRNPKTGQRVLRTTEDARPDSVNFDDERVEIRWRDGHNSQFIHSWLLENSYCHHNIDNIRPAATEKPTQTLWDAGYFNNRELPSVDYEEYMKSDDVLLKMLQKFRQYGLCFIHNTPASEEATGDALRRIGLLRRSYYGDVWTMIAGSMSVNSVAYGTGCIPVHTDHCSLEEAPGVLGLHCIEYNGKGGETMILDGFQVAEHIRQTQPDYFTLLSKVSIPYHLSYKDGIYRARKIIFPVNEKGEVVDAYLNHDDRKPLDSQSQTEILTASGCDPNEAVAKFYDAIRHLHTLIYGNKFVYEWTLAPGQLLVINNRRLFHGRKEFNGYRKLCGAIINREEYQSTLELLENK